MKKQTLFFLMLMVTSALNAQLKVNSSGNIEIGTSPSTDSQFNLRGNSHFDGSVGIGAAPNLTYMLNLAGNSHLTGDSYLEGLVGIGAAPNSSYKLNLLGNSYLNGDTYLNGLVGIGTAPNSSYKLNLVGNSHLKGDSYLEGLVGIGAAPNSSYKLNVLGNTYLNGNVGIGITPSTTYKLNLSGNSYFNGNVGIGITPSTTYKLYVLGKSSFNGDSNFQGLSNFGDCYIGGTFNYFPPYRTSPTYSAFMVYGNDNQPALSINPAYAFSSQYLLYVGGDSYITGSWTSSDNQLKKSVTVLDGNLMLSKIMNIDGKKYEFKNNEELEQLYKDKNLGSESTYKNKLTNLPKGERFGFIAQDIEKEFPELVNTDSVTSLKAINYEGMIPVLLQSIKEQQKMIIDLQNQINRLK